MGVRAERILFMSPNWLGDAVMAMPAFCGLAAANPDAEVCVLARTGVAGLWRMNRRVSWVEELVPGNAGMVKAAGFIRRERFYRAVIVPNSFRSALIAYLGRVPVRRGTAGQLRGLLINDAVRFSEEEKSAHQAVEYLAVAGCRGWDLSDTGFEPPVCRELSSFGIDGSAPCVCVVPGAARGESKRWPHFSEAASAVLAVRPECRFAVCGSAGERALCARVAAEIGHNAVDLSGRTNLEVFASVLAHSDVVVCNDSGGMHLASAAGTPVVAVFGLTDPGKTGPMGKRAVVVRPNVQGRAPSRRIAPDDPDAIAALASIKAETVAGEILKLLDGKA